MARPSLYSDELAARICGYLAEGRSLRRVCRMKGMPDISTVMLWLGKHPAFFEQYARARELQAESLADEIVDIADESQGKDAAGVSAAKLRVEARKWTASKLLPKKYGDKVVQEHTGPGGGPVAHVEVSLEDYRAARQQLLDDY